jgi:hypothetical protein
MGITDKLPLLNSKSKIVKIIGYVLYAFVILMIIGAMAPAPSDDEGTTDTTTDATKSSQTTQKEEPETEDYDTYGWLLSALDISNLVQEKSPVISEEITNMEYDTAKQDILDLSRDVESALDESKEYSVHPKYKNMKGEYEMALSRYVSGYSKMVDAIDLMDTSDPRDIDMEKIKDLIVRATNDINTGVSHMDNFNRELAAMSGLTE